MSNAERQPEKSPAANEAEYFEEHMQSLVRKLAIRDQVNSSLTKELHRLKREVLMQRELIRRKPTPIERIVNYFLGEPNV